MLVFVGTLHGNFTPKDELIEVIESFHPSRLLIEITQQDLDNNNTEKYPPEMQAAFVWATKNHVRVHGIDSTVMALKDNMPNEDLKILSEEQIAIIRQHDWKDFNRPEFFDALRTTTWLKIVDSEKDAERDQEIYNNIAALINSSDHETTVVVTGSGHIPFLRNKFPTAHFPFS